MSASTTTPETQPNDAVGTVIPANPPPVIETVQGPPAETFEQRLAALEADLAAIKAEVMPLVTELETAGTSLSSIVKMAAQKFMGIF